MNAADAQVLTFVNQAINRGRTVVSLPAQLLSQMSAEGKDMLRQLCDLNGVSITVHT